MIYFERRYVMNWKLRDKIKESLQAVVPITSIVLLLCVTITPMPPDTLLLFLAGAGLLILGMGFFTLGADIAMIPVGEQLGARLAKGKKTALIALACFAIGVIITVAEPDLQVLAQQTPGVPDLTLILTVAVGVGTFLVAAFLRMVWKVRLSVLLMIGYAAVFLLSIFVPNEFVAVAFDAGGVTTGPITVPFIMALGIGLAALRNDQNAESDSFGMVSLCSIGPILSVLLLGIVYEPSQAEYAEITVPAISTTRDLGLEFGRAFPIYAKEVLLALLPILVFFFIFQIVFLRLHKKQLVKVLVGMLYTFLGLLLFLTGVNVGFMPVGSYLGKELAQLPYQWILAPLGMVVGFFIVKAEPAVLVLNKQVEEISGGAISQKTMMNGLSVGMALSVGLSMIRILTGISIYWFLVPGYVCALLLSFVVPKMFTAIAFDSGGVASGPMTATFLLPFAMGACGALGGNILLDAFGIVAMVAMTPLVVIQGIGLVYRIKTRHHKPEPTAAQNEIIEYEEV